VRNTIKNNSKQLSEGEKQFQVIFEQAAVGVGLVNSLNGKFLRINKKFCDIVGYSAEEMLNMDFQSITHPEDLQNDLKFKELLNSVKIREFSVEKRYFHKNGSIVWVNVTVSPVWDFCDQPGYNITIIQDITERKRVEEELRNLDRHKYNILSNVTHELRTPLTHALGFLELAMSETDETRKAACLEKCRSALLRENEVITCLIETANLEKGLIKPVIGTMDVGSMINETIQAILPKAKVCGIDVSSEIDDGLFAKGDINLTKLALANLIDNAVKFNRKGGSVDISAYRKNGDIEICFSDTGIGIPRDKIDKIFDKMYQVDSDSTRRYGGIGIGLSTAKSIVEAHRGRIWVESKAGEGSRFFFTIPAGKSV
jgi:PAS domain S-box-containing protein